MKGTPKQTKWAEDIRSRISWDGVLDHPIADKAKSFILGIDNARFWIDNRDLDGYGMIAMLVSSGLYFDPYAGKTAVMDQEGNITVTWREIVSDGKGGHHKELEEII